MNFITKRDLVETAEFAWTTRVRGSRRLRCGCGGSLTCVSLGDKIIMELNDAAKNGDVETAWDSSEVGADAEIEYVPLMRVENSSSTNMGGMHIIQNIPPSSGEGAFVDESLLAVKLTILWVVFCIVLDFATDGGGMGIFLGILSAPFFGGAVLGVRFCWLYGPGILSGWLRELREFFRKS